MSSPTETAATAAAFVSRSGADPFRFRCPRCRGAAFAVDGDLVCPGEKRRFRGESGILPLLPSERRQALAPFLETYRRVRRSEGWGGAASYYLGLPFDSDGRHRDIWKLRARSYRRALVALTSRFPDSKRMDEWNKRSLRVLELGAGNGWFAWRMAQAGHTVLATDISLDEEDGLGAIARYAAPCPAFSHRLIRALADMEELALDDSQFDVVVANGSLHYARRLSRAVLESHRVLARGGLFLVLDSPVFEDAKSGNEMVRERGRRYEESLGVRPPDTTVGYLVENGFVDILTQAGFRVRLERPFEGIRRCLGRRVRTLRRLTLPARFPLFVAEKT